jgi:integrase
VDRAESHEEDQAGQRSAHHAGPFTPDEQEKILAKSQTARIRCFTHVLFYSALRISDACMLRPEDLDGNRLRRVNKKNQRVVLIPIPPYVKKELDQLRLNGGCTGLCKTNIDKKPFARFRVNVPGHARLNHPDHDSAFAGRLPPWTRPMAAVVAGYFSSLARPSRARLWFRRARSYRIP